jgi:hypothetical protein
LIAALLLAGMLGAGDLLTATARNAPAPLPTPVPPVGAELVHPSVFHQPGGWNGYPYWMAVTPYAHSEAEAENPCLYCSLDGRTWTVPRGVVNPLVPRPREPRRYNSDPHLAAGPGGSLLLFFRTAGADRGDSLFLMTSRDGATWTAPKKILDVPLEDERQLSPAVIQDGDRWAMYYVDSSAFPYTVRRRTATSPQGPWSAPREVTGVAAPEGRMLWHLDAFKDGPDTLLLLDATDVYRTQEGGRLIFASSKDGLAFRQAPRPVLAGSAGWDRSIYRSCCLPETKNGHKVYSIWYSAWGPEGWRLGFTELAGDP